MYIIQHIEPGLIYSSATIEIRHIKTTAAAKYFALYPVFTAPTAIFAFH